MTKRVVKSVIGKIILGLCVAVGDICAKLAKIAFKGKMWVEWSLLEQPDNFDHRIDLYYRWPDKCSPHWLERGIYNIQALKMFDDPVVVEVCCGDGFNTKYFYSSSVKQIYAIDYDKSILKHAKKINGGDNIKYIYGDIRTGIEKKFLGLLDRGEKITNIIGDAFFQYFSQEELNDIIKEVSKILGESGIFSGMTPTICNFEDLYQVAEYLHRFFQNVVVFQTIYEERTNIYYYAGNGELPFTPNNGNFYAIKNEDRGNR